MKFDMYCVLHLPAFLTGKCHEISYVLRLPADQADNRFHIINLNKTPALSAGVFLMLRITWSLALSSDCITL